ncbi:MAG TPA: ABC transporter permease [Candidatus Didemnitutus sp.]|nr:ABC transporter permease [Candidatus Didemnitutus sp.]
MHSIKFGLRSLLKTPGFTAVAVLTIAVTIGANTALFSVFQRLVLRPIDLPDAGRLVRIWTNNPDRNLVAPILSVPKYEFFREHQQSFESVAVNSFNSHILTRPGAEPEQLNSLNVSASFVHTLGMTLTRGRAFTTEEDTLNGPAACLLGYDLWKNRFGSREDLVGSTIELNGMPTTVVGILPEHLPAPIAQIQLLVPRPFELPGLTPQQVQGGAGFLQATARLKPGVTFEQADAELRTLASRYQQAFPGKVDASANNELRTWIEEQVGPVRATFVMLLTAVVLVLLIACANVSNLFLGRLSARTKEIAVRLSIGASRTQLVRQFLIEAGLFCLAAAGLGVLAAWWSLAGLQRFLADQLPPDTHFVLSGTVLLYSVGLCALASLAIGLIPALQASRVNLAETLKDTARGSPGGARGGRFRTMLIGAEVALSVVLLVGSALLLVSFIRLQATPAGFKTSGIASAFVGLPIERYANNDRQADLYYDVLDHLHSDGRVTHAAITSGLPLSGFNSRGVYAVDGRPIPPIPERPIATLNSISEDYFSLMGIPLLSGRIFSRTDVRTAPGVVIINESFAKRLYPDGHALGQHLLRGQKADIKMEIVGIVGDTKANGLNTPPPDMLYQPVRQALGNNALSLAAATSGDPGQLQAIIRSAVAAADRTLAISAFTTMDTALEQSLGFQRIVAWLTGAFSVVALVLSAVGLYSVLAYAVSQRTSEIGLRMALGADRSQVIALVLGQGMRVVAIGLVVGLAAAAGGAQLLRSQLYGISALDPWVFAGVTVTFALVALLACLLPSLRAARVDPLVALRTD